MKKQYRFLLVGILALVLMSCGQIHVIYQKDKTNTGTLVIKPLKKTVKTYVYIDDSMIIKNKNVRLLTISHVPAGQHTIRYKCDDTWEYKFPMDSTFTISVKDSKITTKNQMVPPLSTGKNIIIGAQVVIFTALFIYLVDLWIGIF